MIKLSAKGLAKYITASPASQRKILQDFKYPKEDEPFAMRLYYQDAVDAIRAFHKGGQSRGWLLERADDLSRLAALNGGNSGIRLRNNSKAVRQYEVGFGSRRFAVMNELRLYLFIDKVRISVAPELYVIEGKKEKIIRLDFTKSAVNPEVVKIVSQCMFEAARGRIAELTSSSVLYFDVRNGTEYRGARMQSRTLRDVEAACKTISTLWDSITLPNK